jgi:dihydroorotate dehydrogenase electron transfer subunit
MRQSLCAITSNVEVMPGVYLMWLDAPDIASSAQPGQFITVCCEGLVLRRPFSMHQVSSLSSPSTGEDLGEGEIALLFQVVGKGTFWLSQQQAGNKIDVLGPLGKGFNIVPGLKNMLLVGGGIGIAPLIFLAQYASPQYQVALIHGASTAAQIYPFLSLPLTINSSPSKGEEKGEGEKQSNLLSLPSGVQFIPVTEDGTLGSKGMVTDILPDFLDWADQVFACGPVDMYKAMALTLNPSSLKGEGEKRTNLRCQVSLEVRMGCGIGACHSCTINTKHGLKQVCRDGPVFEMNDILWQEVKI